MTTDKTQSPACPNCGSEQGIYIGSDYRWHPATQSWQPSEIGTQLDCTNCDHNWPLEDSGFPAVAA